MLLSTHIPEAITNITIILGLAILVLLICNHFKIPSLLGFILTGVVAGPSFTNLIGTDSNLPVFAEIGVIFLLFSIGIEFSLKDLIRIRKQVFVGGGMQMLLTILVTAAVGNFMNIAFNEAVFIGMLFSLSSTAIVLKLLQDNGRLQSPQGKGSMAILIFQDMAVVPLVLFTPFLSSNADSSIADLLLTLLKAVITIGGVLLLARVIMPKFLFAVAKSRSSELFLLTIIVVCMSVAWLTALAGLSLSLGAFLAGLIISESEYSHEAFGTILPFREVFTSFFFISIGLLVDIKFLAHEWVWIVVITAGVLLAKTLITGISSYFTGSNARVALISGLYISQVGEFAFVLADKGLNFGVLSASNYQLFLSVSLVSMAFTPLIIQKSDSISIFVNNLLMSKALKKRFPRLIKSSLKYVSEEVKLKDHLVVIGYGNTGKNIAKVVRMARIPFAAIDSDPQVVLASGKKKNDVILYGNATTQSVLSHAAITDARVAVISIGGNRSEVKKVVMTIKKMAPHVFIIATTRKLDDVVKLFDLGANDVISEQFETSVELTTRILSRYLVPRTEIEDFVVKLRTLNYNMMRTIRYEQQGIQDYRLEISDTEILTMKVKKDSVICGKMLNELQLRAQHGVSVLAVKRGADITANPHGEMELKEGDILVIFGSHEAVDRMSRI
jgi:CPA2 family monovalent cation:H+ antiporter-2